MSDVLEEIEGKEAVEVEIAEEDAGELSETDDEYGTVFRPCRMSSSLFIGTLESSAPVCPVKCM